MDSRNCTVISLSDVNAIVNMLPFDAVYLME